LDRSKFRLRLGLLTRLLFWFLSLFLSNHISFGTHKLYRFWEFVCLGGTLEDLELCRVHF
jgi:hypothetical protein